MSDVDLHGSVALITGASRGIGTAVAEKLAAEGCHVALVARSDAALEETLRRCTTHGVRAVAVPADLARPEAPEAVVAGTIAAFSRLDMLVNNAGVMLHGAAQDADLRAWDETLNVNLRSLMHLTRHALPHLMRQPRSAILNISSIAGKMGFAGGGAYCASKHGVMGFSEAIFEDVREHGVKVCAICPGYVRTDLISARGGLDPEKMLQPEDVADAVLFVAKSAQTACPTEIVLRPQRTPYR